MQRAEAEERLAKFNLAALNTSERSHQLETMLGEDWSDSEGWDALPTDVQAEFENGALERSPSDACYLPVLMIWQLYGLAGVANRYLLTQLHAAGVAVDAIEGAPSKMWPCPCCGHNSLTELGDFDICTVCWWEDGGWDNSSADSHAGANYLTLVEARVNYLRHGLFDPTRKDLFNLKSPPSKYEKGRVFTLTGDVLAEPAVGWSYSIALISPN